MMKKILIVVFCLCLSPAVFAEVVATVTHLSGLLSVRPADGSSKVLAVGSAIQPGDTLATGRDTYARIRFLDASEVVLRPGSQVKVESFYYEQAKPDQDGFALNLLKGGMRAVTGLIGKRNKEAVRYTTPTATIGIRGTHFGALFCQGDCADVRTVSGKVPEDGLYVDVAQGSISLQNAAGTLVINTGEFGYVRNLRSAPVVVPPESGVQVTMPTAISQNKANDVAGMARGSSAGECVAQ